MYNNSRQNNSRNSVRQGDSRRTQNGNQNYRHKSRVNADRNIRWITYQGGVPVMRLFDNATNTSVQLMLFKSDKGYTNTFACYDLPFKLKDLKTYLLHPYLSDAEKSDTELMGALMSYASDFKKFEFLMKFRIEKIVESFDGRVNLYHKYISNDNDYFAKLTNEFRDSYYNPFIQEILKTNNIKVG